MDSADIGSTPTTYVALERFWRSGAPTLAVRTSGSTGSPKTICLDRPTLEQSARRTIARFGLDRHSRLHSCLSPDTIGGRMVLIRALECGGTFSFETPSNRPLEGFAPSDRLTMVSVVPSQMLHILARLEEGTLPQIDLILIGGSPIHGDLRRRIAASRLEAWESYGMTETASHIAVRRVTESPEGFAPLPGIEVSADGRGCLVISGATPEPIVTNDIVAFDAVGRFTILGRADNVIITGGRKVIPEEVELRLTRSLPPTLEGECEIAVVGLPDPKWGHRVAVAYACSDADRPKVEAWLQEAAASMEPHWSRPRSLIRLPELPKTPNGKLDRKALSILPSPITGPRL